MLGIFVGAGLLIAIILILILNLIMYFTVKPGGPPPAQLLIPGVTIGVDLFLKMIPGIVLIVLSHELSHKIALHLENIDVKSVGFALVFLIPAAFVEPNEKEFNISKPISRLKVLAAGSFANIILALIVLPIALNPTIFYLIISPFYNAPNGVIITEILPNTPLANQSDIKVGDVIIEINGITIKNVGDLRKVHLIPGSIATVKYLDAETGIIHMKEIIAGEDPNNPNRGILGYIPENYYPPKIPVLSPRLPNLIYEVIFWIFFLSLNISMFNMLPIYPLDGYGFLQAVLDRFNVKTSTSKYIMYIATAISILLITMNLTANLIWRLIAG